MKEASRYHLRRHAARERDTSLMQGSGKYRAHWGEVEIKYGQPVLTGKLYSERKTPTQSHVADESYFIWKKPEDNRAGYIEVPKVHMVNDAEVIDNS